MADPELTLPEARHFCPRCSKVFHEAFSCASCGSESVELPEGLHFASDAERYVLDAWSNIDDDWLQEHLSNEVLAEPCAAELERREGATVAPCPAPEPLNSAERSCCACGQSVNHATSSAPIVRLIRLLELVRPHVEGVPELRERIREQLEGPFGHLALADQRVLDAMAALETEMLEYARKGWSAAPPAFHPPCLAELARREALR